VNLGWDILLSLLEKITILSSSQQPLPSLEFAVHGWKLQEKRIFSLIDPKVTSEFVLSLSSIPRNQKSLLNASSLFSE